MCPAGVPTIGYGNTYYEDGSKVGLDNAPISKERAIELLDHTLGETLASVLAEWPDIPDSPRLGAILDFTFNLGIGNLRRSTFLKKAKAGDWAAAADEVLRWDKADGRILPGLTRRRKAESDMIYSSKM